MNKIKQNISFNTFLEFKKITDSILGPGSAEKVLVHFNDNVKKILNSISADTKSEVPTPDMSDISLWKAEQWKWFTGFLEKATYKWHRVETGIEIRTLEVLNQLAESGVKPENIKITTPVRNLDIIYYYHNQEIKINVPIS